MTLPGLTPDSAWDLPGSLNMARQCLDKPQDQIAVVAVQGDSLHEITIGDLSKRTDRVARALLQRVKPGDRVGVLLSQSPDCLAAHLAIWKIGAISVPLFQLFQYQALKTRIEDAGCAIVLTDPEGAALLGDLAEAWDIATCGLDGPSLRYAKTTPDTPAILIYTSGTTGKPKGALHGHKLLTGHLPGVSMSHNHLGAQGDRLWTPADWAWIGGLFDVALAGLALDVPVVAARMPKFTPEGALDICSRARIRNVFFPPTALRMVKASGLRIKGLRSVASGGEPLGAEMLAWGRDAFDQTINEFYGQTECNMVASSCVVDFAPRPGCIGKQVPGFDLQVIDQDGLPTGLEGDIAIRRGAAPMMLEYWNQPEATAQKYRGDYMLTGDRGQWDGEYLRFIGREDDVITSGGYRIGPAEIEDCLLTHPDVVTCGVVGKPDPVRGEIVKAYILRRPGAKTTEDALQDWVKTRLARYAYPREIAFIEELPMTVTGKVVRKALRQRAAEEARQ